MESIPLRSYLKSGLYKTPGYSHQWDLSLFAALLEWQTARSLSGDIVEIGVHHGRSFICLAMCRQPGEKLLAIDLFEDDDFNANDPLHSNRGSGFFANIAKYGFSLKNDEIIKGSSLDLTASRLQENNAPFRFFSIDGGHYYHHVENDLKLAAETLADFGVVCVDDWMNDSWPEVSAAAANFMREKPKRLVPFLVNSNKLYLCRPDFRNVLQQNFLPSLAQNLGPIAVSTLIMFGETVTHVRFSTRLRIEVLVRARLFG